MVETNWLPGLLATALALVAGVLLALRARRGAQIRGIVGGQDLARKRDALFQQIRELDAGRAQMADSDYRAVRLSLELDAARTLRALETETPAPAPPRAPSWGDRHPRLVGAAWGLGVAGFAALVWMSLPTTTDAPAAPATSRDAQVASALEQLRKSADAAPDDNDAQLRYAQALLSVGKAMDAFQVAKRVTDRDPENPTARTYQAAVLIEMGDLPMAAKALDKILASHPENPDALAYRGLVHFMSGERPQAADLWERVVAIDPGRAAEFTQLIQVARGQASAPAMGGPAAAAPSAEAPRTDHPDDIVGRLELGGGAPPPGGVLFVYARPPGVTSGPPVAARRFRGASLPLDFRIGPGDSPMGGTFPGEVTLTARWDLDGDPMTKDPSELVARVDGVKKAQHDVVLSLAPAP